MQQWLAGDASLSVERIEALAVVAPGLGRELARRVVDRMRDLAEAPASGRDLGALLLTCTAELGALARAAHEALADGRVTELERAALRREVRHLADALDALRVAVG